MKVLWTGPETGAWAALFRWYKGYVAPPHKHLSPAHVYVLSGKLQVRDGILEAGDYVYEPNGMVHGATTALEDTDYLFICNGRCCSSTMITSPVTWAGKSWNVSSKNMKITGNRRRRKCSKI